MSRAKSEMATQIKAKNSRATLTHCYSLHFAVGDMIGKKSLEDTLDTTLEISKLLKYLPKREALFKTLKQKLAPGTPGFRTLCPTSWTVRPACPSVTDMLKVLHELCVVCLEAKLDPDIRQHMIGVKHQMEMLDYFYGVNFSLFL